MGKKEERRKREAAAEQDQQNNVYEGAVKNSVPPMLTDVSPVIQPTGPVPYIIWAQQNGLYDRPPMGGDMPPMGGGPPPMRRRMLKKKKEERRKKKKEERRKREAAAEQDQQNNVYEGAVENSVPPMQTDVSPVIQPTGPVPYIIWAQQNGLYDRPPMGGGMPPMGGDMPPMDGPPPMRRRMLKKKKQGRR